MTNDRIAVSRPQHRTWLKWVSAIILAVALWSVFGAIQQAVGHIISNMPIQAEPAVEVDQLFKDFIPVRDFNVGESAEASTDAKSASSDDCMGGIEVSVTTVGRSTKLSINVHLVFIIVQLNLVKNVTSIDLSKHYAFGIELEFI